MDNVRRKYLDEKPEEKDHFEDQTAHVSIILKLILNSVSTGFIWLRNGTIGGVL
jgi:hypothetical protein